jgi:hypothetical protein
VVPRMIDFYFFILILILILAGIALIVEAYHR